MSYDILVRRGHLVDPANHREGRFDVAVESGKVAHVAAEISPDSARTVYEARGCLVMPGLVDTHVHLTPAARSVATIGEWGAPRDQASR